MIIRWSWGFLTPILCGCGMDLMSLSCRCQTVCSSRRRRKISIKHLLKCIQTDERCVWMLIKSNCDDVFHSSFEFTTRVWHLWIQFRIPEDREAYGHGVAGLNPGWENVDGEGGCLISRSHFRTAFIMYVTHRWLIWVLMGLTFQRRRWSMLGDDIHSAIFRPWNISRI